MLCSIQLNYVYIDTLRETPFTVPDSTPRPDGLRRRSPAHRPHQQPWPPKTLYWKVIPLSWEMCCWLVANLIWCSEKQIITPLANSVKFSENRMFVLIIDDWRDLFLCCYDWNRFKCIILKNYNIVMKFSYLV